MRMQLLIIVQIDRVNFFSLSYIDNFVIISFDFSFFFLFFSSFFFLNNATVHISQGNTNESKFFSTCIFLNDTFLVPFS